MTDVNEEIVRVYFELKGYFVYPNLKYTVTKKGIRGDSDIDLAIYNLETEGRAIVEVKGWHSEKFSLSYFTTTDTQNYSDNRLFNFIRPEAINKAIDFFKRNKFRKILVISKLASTQREDCIKLSKERGIDELIEFKEILKYVVTNVKPNKNYRDSEFLQTVRLLKTYGFIITSEDEVKKNMQRFPGI